MMFIAGRRSGSFIHSAERANICAVPARTSDASAAATPYIGRCELAPTTAVRAHAQIKYSTRFLDAYGPQRSRAAAPRHSPGSRSPTTRTDSLHDAVFPLAVTSVAPPSNSHNQTTLSFPTDSPPKPTCTGPRDEGRQHPQSRNLRRVAHAKTYAVDLLATSITDTMTPCNQHFSRNSYARLYFLPRRAVIRPHALLAPPVQPHGARPPVRKQPRFLLALPCSRILLNSSRNRFMQQLPRTVDSLRSTPEIDASDAPEFESEHFLPDPSNTR